MWSMVPMTAVMEPTRRGLDASGSDLITVRDRGATWDGAVCGSARVHGYGRAVDTDLPRDAARAILQPFDRRDRGARRAGVSHRRGFVDGRFRSDRWEVRR